MKLNIDFIYPIGSIYMSVNNVNPSQYFGGTWEVWGAGKVPVGVDVSDGDFSTSEKTGGEKTHKLTANEMPSHRHTMGDYTDNFGGAGNYYYPTCIKSWTPSSGWKSFNVNNTGGDQAHNNLQPYITCYMWKRTA